MLDELQLGKWTEVWAAVALFLSAGVFIWVLISTARMSRERVDHDAQLPLEEEKRNEK
ncbi:MAG: hypothetical protein N2035_10155 [Chthoniobacterales bacterium]|nr:hypothetical protein [Chthoniobacterales bacterium]MCX7714004.1 hypothetical protein [Chthoniobacterales bacterium]